MRLRWWATLSVPLLIALAGCASGRHRGEHLSTSEGLAAAVPPLLLTGPCSILLTNSDDFSARAALTQNSGALLTSGNLFQQAGRLLFVPTVDPSVRANPWAGTFRFLWDVSSRTGYVLSEPLHGYATLPPGRRYTASQGQPILTSLNPERIDDQPCRIEELPVREENGGATAYRLWRATELSDLPVQIGLAADTNAMLLQLTQVRVEAQAAELFVPPDGFARYSGPEAMIHEMERRQLLQRYKPFGSDTGGGRRRRSR